MDSKARKSLEKALDYLRNGRTDKARPIIADVLKRDPGIEEAWYLLSFTVGEPSKQIYALEQALRLNPENDKAAARLEKIQGYAETTAREEEPLPLAGGHVSAPLEEVEIYEEIAEEEQAPPPEEKVFKPGKTDLLSQRLMGIPEANTAADEREVEAPGEPEEPEKSPPPFASPGRKASVEFYAPPVKKLGSEVKPKRRRRWVQPVVLLLLIGAIVGGAWVYIGPDRIISNVGGLFETILGGSEPVATTPTVTPTREPTPEGFRDLPPTWTPTASPFPSDTPLPTGTPTSTDTQVPPATSTPGTPES